MAISMMWATLLCLSLFLERVTPIVISEPDKTYSYIVVGGGTTGLVVARRIAENRGLAATVLVIESGPILDGQKEFDDVLLPPQFDNQRPDRFAYTWNITTIPNGELNGRTQRTTMGKIVGGGSALNGKIFARAAKRDYDDWATYMEDGSAPRNGWSKMLRYFQKSETFTPPTEMYRTAPDGNVTWESDTHGFDGPISATFPAQFYPSLHSMLATEEAMGIPRVHDQAGGAPFGSLFYPASERPAAGEYVRSYSKNEYFDPIRDQDNIHLLPETTVTRILFERSRAVGVEYASGEDGPRKTVIASGEIIVAAGSAISAQILQVSGVGPQKLLNKIGVDVVADLPVGESYQDHGVLTLGYNYFDEKMWREKTNKTWMDLEWQQYLDTHSGYYTSYSDNHMTLLTGPQLFGEDLDSLIAKYRDDDPAKYLRQGAEQRVIDSYRRQVNITLESIAAGQVAIAEFIGLGRISVLIKPLSQGFIEAPSENIFDSPAVAHRTFSHPLDLEIVLASLKMSRRMLAHQGMASLTPVETSPGLNDQSDDELVEWIRNNMSPGGAHGCCSVPRGTVLDDGFSVREVRGLRVVDTSSWPMIPGAHTSQCTAYAVAEWAADEILSTLASAS